MNCMQYLDCAAVDMLLAILTPLKLDITMFGGRDPFTDLDRFLGSMLDNNGALGRGSFFSSTYGSWTAPMDIVESPTHYHVAADLPGLKKEDISINFDDATEKVCIKGTRPHPGYLRSMLKAQPDSVVRREEDTTMELPASGNTLLNERGFGTFERCFHFPSSVDKAKISAQFEAGLLHVALEKTTISPDGASGRVIKIQ